MNLIQLAIIILRIENKSISKVRFAKTIYFVHKELIRSGLALPSDIKYIRMPLGPVPDGFMQLEQDSPDILVTKMITGLAYNSSQYSLHKRIFKKLANNPIDEHVRKIINRLKNISTSELVELSHEDRSWRNNVNGATYNISDADLKNNLPNKISNRVIIEEEDNQLLQASLVNGMIKDIVSESTDLEHPGNESGTARNS